MIRGGRYGSVTNWSCAIDLSVLTKEGSQAVPYVYENEKMENDKNFMKFDLTPIHEIYLEMDHKYCIKNFKKCTRDAIYTYLYKDTYTSKFRKDERQNKKNAAEAA